MIKYLRCGIEKLILLRVSTKLQLMVTLSVHLMVTFSVKVSTKLQLTLILSVKEITCTSKHGDSCSEMQIVSLLTLHSPSDLTVSSLVSVSASEEDCVREPAVSHPLQQSIAEHTTAALHACTAQLPSASLIKMYISTSARG